MISNQLKKSKTFAYGEFTVWNDLYDGKINSDLIVYGSSRAWVHIDPTLIKEKTGISSYNIGIDGHNFWLQYLRHKILLEKNKKPKYIILSVGAFTLQKRKDLFNSNQFLPYMLFDKAMYDFTKSYVGYSHLDYGIPLLRYSGNLKALSESLNSYELHIEKGRIKGYRGIDKIWSEDLATAKKEKPNYRVVFDQPSIDLFKNFMKECYELDIRVVMVYTPEHIEGQKYVKNRDDVINFYQEVSEHYNVPFLDYSNDSICFDKKYFYNASHLNKSGSSLFTKILISDLQSIHFADEIE